jgi:hypothetical protein
MDLKVFYQKVRQVEAGIEEPHVVVISHDTPDGGRAGVASEVKKTVAARMWWREKRGWPRRRKRRHSGSKRSRPSRRRSDTP